MQIIAYHSQRVCVCKVLGGGSNLDLNSLFDPTPPTPGDSSISSPWAMFWEQLDHADGDRSASPWVRPNGTRRPTLVASSRLKTSCIRGTLVKILCKTLSPIKSDTDPPGRALLSAAPPFIFYLQWPGSSSVVFLEFTSCFFPEWTAIKALVPGSRREHLSRTPKVQLHPCLYVVA